MPFSAEICITNTGNTQLGPVLYAYSDLDFYATPFNTNLLTANLIGNCPYVLDDIPEGTLIVLLKDISNGCCVYISLEPTINLCDVCNLGFSEYSEETVSVVSVGNLTGNCDNNINEYKINWLGPGSGSTSIQFTSGIGTNFTYDWEHPLTGTSAIFAPPGIYIPQVESVYLNGVEFQEDLGALSLCFEPITVDAFNCSNGTNPNPIYSHKIEFSNSSQGVIPSNLNAVFELSGNTNFLAWSFMGLSIADTLKISFSGENYLDPIVLEYIVIGGVGGISDFGVNVFPKTADTPFFVSKVLNFENIDRSFNDILLFEVTPNPTTSNTDWTLYIKCLETFNCSSCPSENSPYKIIENSITGTTGTCETTLNISFTVSGCNQTELLNSDLFKYLFNAGCQTEITSQFVILQGVNSCSDGTFPYNFNLSYDNATCNQTSVFNLPVECALPGNNYINYNTFSINPTNRVFEFKFETLSNLNEYVSQYNYALQFSGSSVPTNIDYYRVLYLVIPTILEPTDECGDSTIKKEYLLHPATLSSTTGTTSESPYNYTFRITAQTITDELNYGVCSITCDNIINTFVNSINNSITASSSNYTAYTTTSSTYVYPFYNLRRINTSQPPLSGTTFAITNIEKYMNEMIPASGSPLQPIPILSANTCDLSTIMVEYEGANYLSFPYRYVATLTNPSDVRDYRIYASPIIGNVYEGFPSSPIYSDFVYGYSAGTVYHTDPNYLI